MVLDGPSIAARGLTKRYGVHVALDSVSFEARPGELFGVAGPNGAGKTTLLRLATGLLRPTAGSITVGGAEPPEARGSVGYLPEESPLYEEMRVRDYLRFFGELYGLRKEESDSRGRRLLDALRLDGWQRPIGELSKGMRRKVSIARSLLHEPPVVVYDEPASGLDPVTSRFLLDFIRDLRTQGRTVLISSHNLYQMEALCDRVLVLNRGRAAALGTVDEVKAKLGGDGRSLEEGFYERFKGEGT
jgi:ABC-2 type transport system ATP-binding protein